MNDTLFNSEEIDKWNSSLNSEENVPARGFRRNVSVYPLVCYVNNIIGCYLGKNVEPILVFISRAREHMNDEPPIDEWKGYYKRVYEYLNIIESHLKENGVDTTILNE